jgi:hypothetical protein
VDIAGDITMVPAAATIPIYWSMLTVSAPTTFHDRVEVPSGLRLLLKSIITGGVLTCGSDAGLTVVTAELVTVPVALVALRV